MIIVYIMYSDNWKDQLKNSITTAQELAEAFPSVRIDEAAVTRVIKKYPMLINPYIVRQLKNQNSSFWKQAVPHADEINIEDGFYRPSCRREFFPGY